MNKAILFDMDGVLVDSEPIILAAAMKGLEHYGVHAVAEDFTPFVGAGEDKFIGGVAEKYGVPYKLAMKEKVYELYGQIAGDYLSPEASAPIIHALKTLKEKGYRLALASSADHVKIMVNLTAAGIDPELFDARIGGDDVANKKPSPDIYLLAAKRLGKEPGECTVIEDALNGVQAAKAAGMTCIAVTGSFTADALRDVGADHVVGCTADIVGVI